MLSPIHAARSQRIRAWHWRTLPAVLSALLGAALPTHAIASERPTCAVVAIGKSDALAHEAAEFSVLLENAVHRTAQLVPSDLADAVDPEGAQARATKARAASEALSLARKAYDALDVDTAFEQARRAIFLGSEAPVAQRRGLLTAALLLAGASRYYAGDETGSRDEFLWLFGIDPVVPLDPSSWSPDVLLVAESERGRGAALRHGEAMVRTEPVPARIFVDGVAAGIAPLRLHGLSAGPHNVSAVVPGYAQRDALVSAGGERTIALQPVSTGRDLLAQEKLASEKFGSAEGDEAIRQIGRDAGVQQVLAGRIELRGQGLFVHLLRIAVSDGAHLGEASGEFALDNPRTVAAADALIVRALSP